MSTIEGAESSEELSRQVDLPTLLKRIGRPNLPAHAAAPQHFLSHGSSTNWLVIARELESVAEHEQAANFLLQRPLSVRQQRHATFTVRSFMQVPAQSSHTNQPGFHACAR